MVFWQTKRNEVPINGNAAMLRFCEPGETPARYLLKRRETWRVRTRRSACGLGLLIVLCAGISPQGRAQSTSSRFRPENRWILLINPKPRLQFITFGQTTDAENNDNSLEVGGSTLRLSCKAVPAAETYNAGRGEGKSCWCLEWDIATWQASSGAEESGGI